MVLNQTYYRNVNPDLLDRIPLNAKTVVEVGCGSGALGGAYKLRNPQVQYIGVEAMAEPAADASKVLDQVIVGNAEDPLLLGNYVQDVDCLVYGDVLEHLVNPWDCLRRHLQLLSEDGLVVACIPNAQHWSVIANLLHGQWPLEDQGLFDRTHLRWFTRATIVAGFQQLGLTIHELKPRIFKPDQTRAFLQKLAPALDNLGLDQQNVLNGIAPLQYVITAGFNPIKKLHLDGFSQINPPSMGEVRLRQPMQALASLPGSSMRFASDSVVLKDDPTILKIFVWQRPVLTDLERDFKQIQTLICSGYTIIVDWDDDPRHWKDLQLEIQLTFRSVHAVQVTTPELAELIRPFNPEVGVFPNALFSLPPVSPDRQGGFGLRLFFGALNREKDWSPLIDSLNAELREAPEFWSFSVVHDRRFYDVLDLPPERKSFVPTCSYDRYQAEMSQCDIAFLPLSNTPFNQMKSNLKAIEAGGHGLALLASDVLYERSLVDGVTAQFFRDPVQLRQHLQNWRQQPDRARQLGQQARQWVESECLASHQVARRDAWYRDLASRRDQLNKALFQRVPELAATAAD
jgi:2-polyprenyl-3-methyl-5-hydroxy-6-metoxy-1,4-benzoquinol methylase